MTKPFSHQTRTENIHRLKSESFDVLVIGGGITGAGLALDASMRGLKTALIEKGDFASGTSSKSSKLIHGGLRYIQTKQFKFVFEALRERSLLLKYAPQYVSPLAFIVPIYDDSPVGYVKMAAGLFLYDMLSLGRLIHRHKNFFSKKIHENEPELKQEGLQGGFLYYDCLTNDAALTLSVAQTAHQHGACMANYVQAISFNPHNSHHETSHSFDGRTITVRDEITQQSFEIKTRYVMNATGPWSDLTRKILKPDIQKKLFPSRGIHIVFRKEALPTQHAVVLWTKDKRITFLIPWGDYQIFGTTESKFSGQPEDVNASRNEVDYLIETAKHYFPTHPITYKDILSTYAGIRPLIKDDSDHESSYHASREHEIIEDMPGFFSILGGKLTTYRKMAQDAVDRISKKPCRTKSIPLYHPQISSPPSMGGGKGEGDTVKNHLEWSIQNEMTQTVCDYLMRRTSIFLTSQDQGYEASKVVASHMAQFLNWDEKRIQKELKDYQYQIDLSRKYLSESVRP
ncbi:MAG: glycerol-3-phosphate dehydrogenase/oxidase [Deltaproteobacteria bacterium]|nr:glycerol-3-phosphate dehydrogenase/oxidase [Deltaproteobacteria bacterium]